MSFKTKFFLATSSLILIVVGGMMLTLYWAEKKQFWAEIQNEHEADLLKLAGVCDQSLMMSDELILINYVKTLLMSPKVAVAGFVSTEGAGWNYSRDQQFELFHVDSSVVKPVVETGDIIKKDITMSNGDHVVNLIKPVRDKGYVQVGYSAGIIQSIFQNRMKSKIDQLVLVGLIAVICGLFFTVLLGRTLSRPILLLQNAAFKISKGNKGIQVPERGSKEVVNLIKTFNHMSEELIKLDQMKDDFMAHVTHELRSPLTSIMATAELMAEMPLVQHDMKLKRSVDRLIYGSERLGRLIDNILDVTRFDGGKMVFDIQPIDVSQMLLEMKEFFEPRALEKSLEIRTHIPPHVPLAMADPERIRQVLSNLIHNAIKFTNKGWIILWVKQVYTEIQVGVQDTGVGIPKDKLQTVFEKFVTLDDTKNRLEHPVPGSGLGLNIVYNSIKAQHGRIWVESDLDKGSIFIFTLPLAPSDVQRQYFKTLDEDANKDSSSTLGSKKIHLNLRRAILRSEPNA